MEQLRRKYNQLKSQLVNPGGEESSDEVLWNEVVYMSIDKLLEEVNKVDKNKIINGFI